MARGPDIGEWLIAARRSTPAALRKSGRPLFWLSLGCGCRSGVAYGLLRRVACLRIGRCFEGRTANGVVLLRLSRDTMSLFKRGRSQQPREHLTQTSGT